MFKRLIVTGASVAFGVTLYEVAKQVLFPHIAIWESHALTVLVATIMVTVATYATTRRVQRINEQLEARLNETLRLALLSASEVDKAKSAFLPPKCRKCRHFVARQATKNPERQ